MGAQASSDSELILRIAAQRDQAAFQELYERYAQPAYNLALYFTRNPAEAEDAVQNAFVSVWKFAGKYRESGAPRSWLLRIVANAATRMKRNRRARTVPIEHADAEPRTARVAERQAGPEARELHAALQRGIETLPEATRQVIALYYGADLTQREIGEMLELPQTTVSMKLREAVEKLRLNLAGAGFAAAAPLLESGALGDAMLTCKPVPPSLGAKVLGNLAKAADITQRVSRRAAPLAGKATLGLAIAGVLVAGAAAGWWALSEPSVPTARDGAGQKTAVATEETAPEPKAAASERIHKKYSFAEGKLPGFEEFGAPWQWVPAEGGAPAGLKPGSSMAKSGLLIPLQVPAHRCWEVRVKAYQLPGAEGLAMHAELGTNGPATRYTLFRQGFSFLRDGGPIEAVSYVQDDANWNSVTFWADGGKHRMGTIATRFDALYERIPNLILGALGAIVSEIEVREVTREEIPMPYRDLDALVKAFNLKPEARKMNRNSPESGQPRDED
ncbi:MAG: sigma-70 family RNA polymerase sigma factor [Planctomycetes bacterium]|nr:sigma-70 family RNA polymerase sigma factor [Planctomycetota bacterium]